MPIYKRCSRCGKRIQSGSACQCMKSRHKEYDRYSRDKKCKNYYDSKEWAVSREAALARDEGIDVYAFMMEGKILAADMVHHIEPLKDRWDRRNDIDNLMSLNSETHSMIERMYKKDKTGMEKKLKEMLREYRDRGGAV